MRIKNYHPLNLFFLLISFGNASESLENFGEFLGRHNGTIAYSNGNNAHVSQEYHQVIEGVSITTGMKWQCVEYARRWLIQNRKHTFLDVDFAYNIWHLSEAYSLNKQKRPARFIHCLNGLSSIRPSAGDLLIYNTKYAENTGHVAVIIDVEENLLKLAEQNHNNRMWADPDSHSRTIIYKKIEGSKLPYFHVLDTGVIGWMKLIEHTEEELQ